MSHTGDAAVRCSVGASVGQSPAEQDEPGGAVAQSGVRLQELEHLFVGAAPIPGEGVADLNPPSWFGHPGPPNVLSNWRPAPPGSNPMPQERSSSSKPRYSRSTPIRESSSPAPSTSNADLVDRALDLAPIVADYTEKRGYPPCDPRLMVRMLIYGYITGVRPSRAIERRCVDDVAFRLLSTDQAPDARSIARFRRRHLDALADLVCFEAGPDIGGEPGRVPGQSRSGAPLRAGPGRSRRGPIAGSSRSG